MRIRTRERMFLRGGELLVARHADETGMQATSRLHPPEQQGKTKRKLDPNGLPFLHACLVCKKRMMTTKDAEKHIRGSAHREAVGCKQLVENIMRQRFPEGLIRVKDPRWELLQAGFEDGLKKLKRQEETEGVTSNPTPAVHTPSSSSSAAAVIGGHHHTPSSSGNAAAVIHSSHHPSASSSSSAGVTNEGGPIQTSPLPHPQMVSAASSSSRPSAEDAHVSTPVGSLSPEHAQSASAPQQQEQQSAPSSPQAPANQNIPSTAAEGRQKIADPLLKTLMDYLNTHTFECTKCQLSNLQDWHALNAHYSSSRHVHGKEVGVLDPKQSETDARVAELVEIRRRLVRREMTPGTGYVGGDEGGGGESRGGGENPEGGGDGGGEGGDGRDQGSISQRGGGGLQGLGGGGGLKDDCASLGWSEAADSVFSESYFLSGRHHVAGGEEGETAEEH
uniref:C2H2-type domain-containing protein n=1 Tax=Chromera velia CCMP2878 TaxID=1169474 RepID=A0A0G4GY80_9ALVE|eukprot:Cvel_23878.t1-p1 / transcript=Cvel_23878.t1 / gene=Cvel_23878 / organism=Chromera_velia_CCMP2878 / gene_product=hypothetical protein / transcript_product=hypothetical protein / location=Cvel_scaffold2514:10068-12661(-) / protein_length=447 / sequence_SO=supercontig / SO=protein_coding / is_pseudo=false